MLNRVYMESKKTFDPVIHLWKWWFTPRSTDPTVEYRERALRFLLPVFILLRAVAIANSYSDTATTSPRYFPIWVAIAVSVLLLISLYFLLKDNVGWSGTFFLLNWYLMDMLNLPADGYWNPGFQISLIIQVVLAALLLPGHYILPFLITQLITLGMWGRWLDINHFNVPLLSSGEPVADFLRTLVTLGAQETIILFIVRYLRMQMEKSLRLQQVSIQKLEAEVTERQRTEARLRGVFENSPDIILEIDRAGQIIFINQFAETLLGKNVRNVLPADQHKYALEMIERAFNSGEPQAFELQTIAPDNRISWDSIRIGAIKQGDQITSLTVIMTEITSQKDAEVALRAREELYRLISTITADYVFSTQLEADGKMELKWVGGAFESITGYSFDEYMERGGWRTTLHPDDLEKDARDVASLSVNQDVISELRTFHKNGDLRWVRVYAHPLWDSEHNRLTGIYGAVQDITERKQIEERVRQSNNQLAMINEIGRAISALQNLESVLEIIYQKIQGIALVDAFFICLLSEDKKQLSFPLTYDMGVRYDEEDTQLRSESRVGQVIQTGEPYRLHRTAEEVAEAEKKPEGGENPQRRSGSLLYVPLWQGHDVIGVMSIQSYTLNAYSDEIIKTITGIGNQAAIAIQNSRLFTNVQQELTRRKQVETERELFIKKIEMQNAELERFNYTISHELKSPVVTIKGFLGMLKKDLEENRQDSIQKDFKRISEAAEKMGTLLSDLLELSKIGRVVNPPTEVDLGKLAHEALEMMDGRLQSRNIKVNVSPDLPVVYGDQIRLREVIENLIDNAAKYMGEQAFPLIEIGHRESETETIFYVKDNGIGIDPKYHTQVFGLFNMLNANSEGTGIGLALIKRIIEVHGGRIWVESEGLGKGSTFCFTIPSKKE